MSELPFICVNYNSRAETLKYIENVLSLDDNKLAFVVVVDNSPTNDDFLFLTSYIKQNSLTEKVHLIQTQNKGYFHALNVGINYVHQLNKNCSYMVVGNNDIIFKPNFISQMYAVDLQKDYLIIAPDVITNDGSHENPHVINKMGFLRKLKYTVYYSHYYIARLLNLIKSTERPYKQFDPKPQTIYMAIGALYILTPNFFAHFNDLWDEVFLYGEEAVLAGQMNSVNGKIFYHPSLTCYHNESSTTSRIEKKSKYQIVQKSYKTYKKYL